MMGPRQGEALARIGASPWGAEYAAAGCYVAARAWPASTIFPNHLMPRTNRKPCQRPGSWSAQVNYHFSEKGAFL